MTSIFAIIAHSVMAIDGWEVQAIIPGGIDDKGFAISADLFTYNPRIMGFIKTGIYFKPEVSSNDIGYAKQSYGLQSGYIFMPKVSVLRPGMFLGVAYDEWARAEGSEWIVHPYIGAEIQISILTLSLSSRGLGLGLNLPL